jgi:hypothetical protein
MEIARQTNRATWIIASTMGILVGLAGIIHGCFEILQGNTTPSSLLSEAIGPSQRFWEYGTLHALTIVPNYLVTGILALSLGVLVVIWAWSFFQAKYGAAGLMLLTMILFLVGGGFAPIFMAIIASLTATRINKPLKFWRALLPGFIRIFLGKIWLGTLVAFVLIFIISVFIAIFGWPLTSFYDADTSLNILNLLSYIMLGLMLLAPLTGFAYDIQTQLEKAIDHHG